MSVRVSELKSTLHMLSNFAAALPKRSRQQLVGLIFLMGATSAAEMASLASLIPFLILLSSNQSVASLTGSAAWIYDFVSMTGQDPVVTTTFLFCFISVITAALRGLLNLMLARVNFGIGHEVGTLIYHHALIQPYAHHVKHNSTETIGAIAKVDVALVVLLSVLIGLSSGLIALCIIATLLYVNATAAVIAVLGFGASYIAISRMMHKRLLLNGEVINNAMPSRQQLMNESFGSIREIILNQTQSLHKRRFDEVDYALRLAQESNQALMPLPRYLIECIAMVAIAVIGCWFSINGGGIMAALPTLGVLALGGQRLLPLMQQTYQGLAMISGHRAVISDLTELIVAATRKENFAANYVPRIQFNQQIKFDNVAFRFEGSECNVLQSVCFTIPLGARVGIIGPTGSGKSTLLNLLMGLLEPTDGQILIDGQPLLDNKIISWQKNIAHVPQSIFLADATIKENVAVFNSSTLIDEESLADALRRAQLMNLISTLPNGVDTLVGENGVRLSGGQRQRLGIARALYKRASVLILDEATSALDEQTEAEFISSVDGLDRDVTVLMIAHRMSTLSTCDFLLKIESGKVTCINPQTIFFPRKIQ